MENSRQLGEQQYADAANFNARIYLNSKFKTNPYPWPAWVFDQIEKQDYCRVLELGCGTGLLWQVNTKRIPAFWEILLSDYSQGMLADTQKNLSNIDRKFSYQVINVEDIGLPDHSFDILIANNMLYHISNREKAFQEIKRVLKESGVFYAATASENNTYELRLLLREFKKNQPSSAPAPSVVSNFSLENGADQLQKFFPNLEMRRYDDSLVITEATAIVNYFLSLNDIYEGKIILPEDQIEQFRNFISKKIADNGNISVAKSSGIFICKN